MIQFDVLYGEKCPQRKDIKKNSMKICESCPYVKDVCRTFSTCHLHISDKMDVEDQKHFDQWCEEANKHIEDYL